MLCYNAFGIISGVKRWNAKLLLVCWKSCYYAHCLTAIYMSPKGKHNQTTRSLLNTLINFISQISDLIKDKIMSRVTLYDL